jgi:ABC-2 type transport system ATP-binding protein
MTPVLDVKDLRKQYRSLVAVDALSFALHPGEFVGLIGPNGAGKSSTMRTIVGLQLPDAGTVTVGGCDAMRDPVGVRRATGYVPQDLELYQYLTGEELLRFVGQVRGVEPALLRARLEELVKLCQLDAARGRLVREYSGGMARKVAMAAALVAEPPLLVLDESFVGMDPESTYRLRRYLDGYVKRGGCVLLSSHILDMLERACSRVLVMHKGKLVADLTQADLQARFQQGPARDLTQLYLTLTDQVDLIDGWDL